MVDSKSKVRLAVVTVFLLGIIAVMVWQSSSSPANYSYFKKIGEVTKDDSLIGKSVRVGGEVLKDSVVQKGSKYTFKIHDKDQQLQVTYSGQMPSTFGAGVTAIVEGTLVSKDMLQAKSIVTQCPSKYKSKKIGGN